MIEVWQGSFDRINEQGWVEYQVYFNERLIDLFCFKIDPSLREIKDIVRRRLLANSMENMDSFPISVPWHISNFATHCWRVECKRLRINRLLSIKDGDYGNRCPNCGNSLREHPFFGEETEYDKGDSRKWKSWCELTRIEKALVYQNYGFPVPQR